MRKPTPDIMGDLLNGSPVKPKPAAFDLIVPSDFDYDQWVEFGKRIATADAKIRFVIGDWIVAGDRKWGDIYTDAARITGKDEKYLRDCVWVSNAFQLSERSDKLSWSHHWRLASAPEDQRIHLMNTVEGEKLSVRETKLLVDESRTVDGTGGQINYRGKCRVCGKPLTSADSVAKGMGDVCAAHAARNADIEQAKEYKASTPVPAQTAYDASVVDAGGQWVPDISPEQFANMIMADVFDNDHFDHVNQAGDVQISNEDEGITITISWRRSS